MKTAKAFATLVLLIPVLALGIAWSGLYNVAATSPHNRIVDWLLSTTSHQSIERRARAIAVPDLDDDALVLAGINDFDVMCAGCHGAPGKLPNGAGQGLMPPPPDLAESAAHLSPAELFWVTKHGIRMTGMPAWGNTHGDDELWPVVSFMVRLPDLDEAGYQDLLSRAQGHGHHAPQAPRGTEELEDGAPPAEEPHEHPPQDAMDANEVDEAHGDHEHSH